MIKYKPKHSTFDADTKLMRKSANEILEKRSTISKAGCIASSRELNVLKENIEKVYLKGFVRYE